jgi:hypothetical protein
MNDGFKVACSGGHLESAKWYWQQMDDIEFIESNIYDIFHNVCKNGHLVMAKWLYNKYSHLITSMDREYYIYICEKGYIEMAKWLFELYPDILDDNYGPPAYLFHTFTSACKNGHIELAKWLMELKPNILEHNDNNDSEDIFWKVCRRGHFELGKWLYGIIQPITNLDRTNEDHYLAICEKVIYLYYMVI